MVGMKFSNRYFLAIFTVLVVVFGFLAASWYRNVYPTSFSSWENIGRGFNEAGEPEYTYFIAGFSQNRKPFAGYLVKTRLQRLVRMPEWSWLEVKGRGLFVSGKRLLPRSRFQLLFSIDGAEPELILLDSAQQAEFRNLQGSPEETDEFLAKLKRR